MNKKYLIDNEELMKEYNYEKNNDIELKNITTGMNKKIWWKCSVCNYEYEATPNNRKNGRGCPYCANKVIIKGKNDLFSTNPELKSEWNYDKNIEIKPYNVSAGSSKKVWWKCNKNHEWQAPISNRARLKRGCPYCSNQKVLYGYNDFETLNPELMKEWDFNKNKIYPNKIVDGYSKKVWWKCSKCSNEWEARIADRKNGNNCPYCSSRKIKTGFNDLATLRSDLLNEWDYQKNLIFPCDIGAGSARKVWWICHICGNKWEASVVNRIRGSNCPMCSKKRKNK